MRKTLISIISGKATRESGFRLTATISLIVVGVGVFSIFLLSNAAKNQYAKDLQNIKIQQSSSLSTFIEGRLSYYQQVLFAASGLFNVNSKASVTRNNWNKFVTSLELEKGSPEILGVGFIDYISHEDLSTYLEQVRNEGFPSYNIAPNTVRDQYTAVKYIEPFNNVNKKVFGFDMSTEPIRNEAMIRARDSGRPIMSAPVVAKQDEDRADKRKPLSVFLFLPIYSNGTVPGSVEQRRNTLDGYVYIVVRAEDMFRERKKQLDDSGASYYVDDESGNQSVELYGLNQGVQTRDAQVEAYVEHIAALNRSWKTMLNINNSSVGRIISPLLMFFGGILGSMILGATTLVLLTKRNREMHQTHEEEIQKTKDELLAIASHQLRTPASGVKQYLGMLSQGYFGNLTPEQSVIAKKAYNSNERQLEIIDQLLYVAKADAGQLLLSPEPVKVKNLLIQIIDAYQDIAQEKNLNLVLKASNSIICQADGRYLRMIIENLISNAIKYSYPKSKVIITLVSKNDNMELEIIDHGVGIEEADLKKLFQKFSRIENPLSRFEGGSGLGLFLAERLAESHRGKITVESTLNIGSTFKLTLPLKTKLKNYVVQITE